MRPPTTALVIRPFESFEAAANALIDAKRSECTRVAYRSDLRRWVAHCVETGTDPHSPTIMDSTVFRDSLRARLAEGSARRVVAGLSSIYRMLLVGRVVRSNPFHPAILAWPVANKIPTTQLVSDEVAHAMIAHAEQDRRPSGLRDATILQLLYDTGLRRSSVAGLLRASYRKPALRAIVKGGSEVEIDLPETSTAALDRWLRRSPSSLYVFPGTNGHINVATINALVGLHARAVGAGHVHPHCFRAAFATAGYDAELPEYEIQAGMHHKDPTTTRRYDRGARGSSTATKIAKFRNRKGTP